MIARLFVSHIAAIHLLTTCYPLPNDQLSVFVFLYGVVVCNSFALSISL